MMGAFEMEKYKAEGICAALEFLEKLKFFPSPETLFVKSHISRHNYFSIVTEILQDAVFL